MGQCRGQLANRTHSRPLQVANAAGDALTNSRSHPHYGIPSRVYIALCIRDMAEGIVGKHFLVVDDSHDSANAMQMVLEVCGQIAHCVYDGRSAVEVLRLHTPDYILLDLRMPGIDGFETLIAIRELTGGANLTVAAYTGWAQPAVRERAEGAGFNHFLSSPPTSTKCLANLCLGIPIYRDRPVRRIVTVHSGLS